MKKIKAHALKSGMNIGLVALSTPATRLKKEFRLRAYERILQHFGLNIIEASNFELSTGHTAGTAIERAQTLNRFFRDKNIHGIMSFWGGLNTNHILEHLDYDLIRRNPKVLIGYSDTTALLTAVQAKTGLITFNGPAVISFAKPQLLEQTELVFNELLFKAVKKFQYPISEKMTSNLWWENDHFEFQTNPGVQVLQHGLVEGTSVGGNMAVFLSLASTPYWPSIKNKILILEEDENESVGTIDRYLTQMRLMGIFAQIKGLVVGRLPAQTKVTPEIMKQLLKNALKGYSVPTIYEFDFGHTDPLSTIPIGAKMKLDTRKKALTLMENVVQSS